jgi:hypothetical protein
LGDLFEASMRSFRHLLVLSLAAAPLAAQATLPLAAVEVQFRNALPPGAKSTQLVVSRDTLHVYYSDSARALWAYDRAAGRATRLAAGEIWDLTIARNADALAYRRLDHATAAQQVWMLPLDARTGLAAGRRRTRARARADDALHGEHHRLVAGRKARRVRREPAGAVRS